MPLKPIIQIIPILLALSIPGRCRDRQKLEASTVEHICKASGPISARVRVEVLIEMGEKRELSIDEINARDQDPAWQREHYSDWAPVKRVLIKVNGHLVDIPQSAFQDLFAISGLTVVQSKGAIELRVGGGDAGDSYSATFKIVQSPRMKSKFRIAERVLRHGEFRDEIWEKTIYQNKLWDDPNL